jgi:hypothetical protein
VGIGQGTGTFTTGSNNTCLGQGANASTSLIYATALGSGAVATTSNTIQLGRTLDNVNCPNTLSVTSNLTVDTNTLHVDAPNNRVGIGTTTPGYELEVNGSFAATTKSFVIEHPTKEGMKLRYGSLEGPENGIYIRGRCKASIIELPEYWVKLVNIESISVNLTPVGSYQNLFVEKIENNKVYIKNSNMLNKSIDCFFVVYGERCDVEKLKVEYDN